MNLLINKNQKNSSELVKKRHFTKKGLLKSDYKAAVEHNFKNACKKTIFGIRQRHKSPDLCKPSRTTSILLKVAAFALAFVAFV